MPIDRVKQLNKGSMENTESILNNGNDVRYEFTHTSVFHSLCGVADQELDFLEELLHVELIPRQHYFLIRTDSEEKRNLALRFFRVIEDRFGGAESLFPERFDREYIYRQIVEEAAAGDIEEARSKSLQSNLQDRLKQKIVVTHKGKPIYPRTINQARYIESIFANSITFSLGPAGTGKTYLGIAGAARLLTSGQVERIILTRPAVEAGESLGFLPGDLAQKVDPYLRPVYDALYEIFGIDKVGEMIASQRIEIAPLAYMRGRTLNHSCIILDEAQNCTLPQIKMFLTRLGKNSRMCIGGDVTQVDLAPGKTGLVSVVNLLKDIDGIGLVEFGKEDIIRNPIVEKIVRAFETMGNNNP